MHNKIQAQLLLDATLNSLEQNKLSPEPDNYRLWFEYARGSINALNQEIDTLKQTNDTISESLCADLFESHLANHDVQQIGQTRKAIGDMLAVMVEHLKDWDDASTDFCEALDQCIDKLNQNPSIEEVKQVIIDVTEQTKQVRQTNITIHNSLYHLTEEIAALRKDVDRLGHEAETDSLTELLNRRGFDSHLQAAIEQATAKQQDLALIIADIDDFKRINDHFGHPIGDKVLRFIASIMKKQIRGSDMVARFGGEEFGIILPNTSLENGIAAADNLLRAISRKQLTTGKDGKVIGNITLSIGVGQLLSGETMENFVDRVDAKMYHAKKQGKNCVAGT